MDDSELRAHLRAGQVIPAHPLALDDAGRLDERGQRVLTRYYLAAGTGGVAVGVHTTQFEIREHGLLEPVLALAADTARAGSTPFALVAGAIGTTTQALAEAAAAHRLGYDAVLLSLGGLRDWSDDALLAHCRAVSEVLPLFAFYLQRAVGGRELSESFWARLGEIDRLVAVKIAPFSRYATLDVLRGLAAAGRDDVALYTGNDDSIVADLLTPFTVATARGAASARITGGLLGHWAVWTRPAVEYHRAILERPASRTAKEWMALGSAVTEMNAALFDPANDFRGCIPGINTVLHEQGLIASPRTLARGPGLSPGQRERIRRVRAAFPHLVDDDFVAAHLEAWRR